MPDSSQCDAVNNSFLVLHEIVLPGVQPLDEVILEEDGRGWQPSVTDAEVSKPSPTQDRKQTRVLGAKIRYERINFDTRVSNLDGDVYSTSVHPLWNIKNFTLGLLGQYDFFDLERFDAHRVSLVTYGQYHHRFYLPGRFRLIGRDDRVLSFRPFLTLSVTANGNYTHTAITNDALDNVNTVGGGGSVALTLDRGTFVVGGAVVYQVHADDSKSPNDTRQLVKIGMRAGIRLLRQTLTLTFFGHWTYDITTYERIIDTPDDTYIDVGGEVVWNVTRTVRMTGGYKKVLELNDFDSDMIFLGTLLRF
jgi:hypothetical protein